MEEARIEKLRQSLFYYLWTLEKQPIFFVELILMVSQFKFTSHQTNHLYEPEKNPEGTGHTGGDDFPEGLNQILILMRGGKKVKYCK
jgi:hypothetical protein